MFLRVAEINQERSEKQKTLARIFISTAARNTKENSRHFITLDRNTYLFCAIGFLLSFVKTHHDVVALHLRLLLGEFL